MRGVSALFMILLVVLAGSTSSAASGWGTKGGLALSTEDFQYAAGYELDSSYSSGFVGGVFLELDTCWGFGVVAEALYVQKGMGLRETVTAPGSPEPAGTLVIDQRVNYISVPVLVKRSIPLSGWSAYAAAGPRFDFMLDYHAELGFDEVYEDFSSFDVGMDIAVGADIGRFLAELRYCPTFTRSYDSSALEVTGSGFLFLGGVRF